MGSTWWEKKKGDGNALVEKWGEHWRGIVRCRGHLSQKIKIEKR